MSIPEVVLIPRHGVGELLAKYHAGEITYSDLRREIAGMGYSTVSLYEMVIATRPEVKQK